MPRRTPTGRNVSQLRKYWHTLSYILGSTGHRRNEGFLSVQELVYFTENIQAIRHTTCGLTTRVIPETEGESFSEFEKCAAETIEKVIRSALSMSCSLDQILNSEFLPKLLPLAAQMCNASLQEGCLSVSQRQAIIRS